MITSKTIFYTILGTSFIVFVIILSFFNNNFLMDKILASAFVLVCLMLLKCSEEYKLKEARVKRNRI